MVETDMAEVERIFDREEELLARIEELEALLIRARERIYWPVEVDPNDALWNDIGRALAAAEKR